MSFSLEKKGLFYLPPGQLAAVVSYLQMRKPPLWVKAAEGPAQVLQLHRQTMPELVWYRTLYREVGTSWLWFSRLKLEDRALAAIIHHPKVDVYHVLVQGASAGLVELDCREKEQIEIAFFGLKPAFTGKGLGRMMMRKVLRQAWRGSPKLKRVWVHTCTLDHPGALAFYQKFGFQVYKRAVEVMDDPRVNGLLPKEAGPHIPLIIADNSIEGEVGYEGAK